MKKYLLISFFLISNFIIAQNINISIDIPEKNEFQKAIIYFNDGTSLEGIGKIKTIFTSKEEVIVFKIEEKDKNETWTVKDAKGITIITEDEITHYEYLKVSKYSFPELYEVVTEGNITLYKKRSITRTPANITPSTISSKIEGKTNPTNLDDLSNTHLKTQYKSGSVEAPFETENATYYMKRETEEFPTKIKDNYIKSTIKYMKDCDVIVEKIKNHKYNYSELKDLVDYYNANCGE